mmetsp:Transcript_49286/g.86103  ORF Transcript_49286/g.86103 Transcript_49286/m.86103 type:complete len:307 (-) Transcript_49286:70-990(-)
MRQVNLLAEREETLFEELERSEALERSVLFNHQALHSLFFLTSIGGHRRGGRCVGRRRLLFSFLPFVLLLLFHCRHRTGFLLFVLLLVFLRIHLGRFPQEVGRWGTKVSNQHAVHLGQQLVLDALHMLQHLSVGRITRLAEKLVQYPTAFFQALLQDVHVACRGAAEARLRHRVLGHQAVLLYHILEQFPLTSVSKDSSENILQLLVIYILSFQLAHHFKEMVGTLEFIPERHVVLRILKRLPIVLQAHGAHPIKSGINPAASRACLVGSIPSINSVLGAQVFLDHVWIILNRCDSVLGDRACQEI